MSARASTKECYKCNHIFPITELKKKKVTVNSGRSGTSWSMGQRKKSGRVYSGRKYYRNKTVFICDDCCTVIDDVSIFFGNIFDALFGLISFLIQLAFWSAIIWFAIQVYNVPAQ